MSKTLWALVGLLLAFGVQAQNADTLKKIRSSKSIALGFRADSPPFSFTGSDGQPAGYSVDLCKRVAAGVERQLNVGTLAVKWVPVTAANRFDQVTNGAVDLEWHDDRTEPEGCVQRQADRCQSNLGQG
jgi:ABC-type amino acid transport substrate-binding protein